MMDLQPSSIATSLAFIFSSFDRFFSERFPSIGICFILPAIPFRVFFATQAVLGPPFCRTRMTTKKMFGMKVRRWAAKHIPAPVALFCKSVASPWVFPSYFSDLCTFTGTIFLCLFIGFIKPITYFTSFCNFIYHNYKIIHIYNVVKIEEEKTKISAKRIEKERSQLKLWN